MIPRIKELLRSTPFSPFAVRTSDGREYTVPTPDHAAVNPKGTYVVLFSDNDSHANVAGLHVATVVEQNQHLKIGTSFENVLGSPAAAANLPVNSQQSKVRALSTFDLSSAIARSV